MTPLGRPALVAVVVAAARREVGGDALIRLGLRGRGGPAAVGLGCLCLAGYGLAVNLAPGDFARLMGSYIAIFALIAVLVARFGLGESIPPSTWIGLALIGVGAGVIQLGSR